jgi:ribose transport system ATP-binding protein
MSQTPAPSLRVERLSKSFGSVRVLREVSMEIAGGEFVGLVGPNGAGKSTLIKVLAGIHRPSEGSISLAGRVVDSLENQPEVAFIHQDLGLVDDLSITDNLQLGRPALRLVGPFLDRGAERGAAEAALDAVGVDLDVSVPVAELSAGEKTLVAIARAFAQGARILVVDEATSTLTGADARRVVDTLAASARGGATVIMVSHRLSEILDATHRVVLLLDGRVAADRSTAGMGRSDLVELLASHERSKSGARAPDAIARPVGDDQRSRRPVGAPVLELVGARGGHAGPVDLEVRAGEIVGLTGTPGSGLHDIGFLAYGSMPLTGGHRFLRGNGRAALVPPHRESQGGFGALDVRSNLTISRLSRWCRYPWLIDQRRERHESTAMVDRLDVRPRSISADFEVLSGGNKQKVIFGRALLKDAALYVLCEPTRGVDVDARRAIYELIESLPDEATGVLVVSSDPEDLFAVCDRVAVVSGGAPDDFHLVSELTEEDLEALL